MYVDAVGFDGAVEQFVHRLPFDSEVMACHFGSDGRAQVSPSEMVNLTPNPRRRGGESEIPCRSRSCSISEGSDGRRENTFWAATARKRPSFRPRLAKH